MRDVLVVDLDVQPDAAAGRTGHAGAGPRTRHRRIGEGRDDVAELIGVSRVLGGMPGHGVELDEDVLHVLVRAVGGALVADTELDVAAAGAIGVEGEADPGLPVWPERAVLPAVVQPIAVRVLRSYSVGIVVGGARDHGSGHWVDVRAGAGRPQQRDGPGQRAGPRRNLNGARLPEARVVDPDRVLEGGPEARGVALEVGESVGRGSECSQRWMSRINAGELVDLEDLGRRRRCTHQYNADGLEEVRELGRDDRVPEVPQRQPRLGSRAPDGRRSRSRREAPYEKAGAGERQTGQAVRATRRDGRRGAGRLDDAENVGAGRGLEDRLVGRVPRDPGARRICGAVAEKRRRAVRNGRATGRWIVVEDADVDRVKLGPTLSRDTGEHVACVRAQRKGAPAW